MMSRLLMLVWVACVLGSSGCSYSLEQRSMNINIDSDPPGALVWQWNAEDKTQLGRAPVSIDHSYSMQIISFNRWWWLLPAVSSGMTAAGVSLLVSDADSTSGAVFTSVGFSGLLIGLMVGLVGELIDGSEIPVQDKVRFSGSMVGFSESFTQVSVGPPESQTLLTLQPLPMLSQASPASAQGKKDTQVVAVFDIRDQTTQFEPMLLSQLNDYLVAQLSRSGRFQVVPRQLLKASMLQMKKESYRQCYDRTCQIELGRAVAAQSALVTSILKVEPGCVLSATLYDLRTETTIAGANAKSACDLDGLIGAANQVVAQLTGSLGG
ncbi:MAG: hypothetical protein JRF33_27935 [Deltaproteobacteria bacterium]|nr:hypothetical protein [Deltaproteobacteria bacterium]